MLKIVIIPGHQAHDPFWDIYDVESRFFSPERTKIFLGNKEKRICRFCNRDSSATTFKKQDHVIPEFMANKVLLSYFECDECNLLFSKYEMALSYYGGIMNTLALLNGKNGVPKFKGKNESLQVAFNRDKRLLNVRLKGSNIPINTKREDWQNYIESFKISDDQKSITFKTNKPTYIPRDVYKALVKIGFGFLHPDNIYKYERTRQWLINEIHESSITPSTYFHVYKNHGKLFRSPLVLLAKKKNEFKAFPSPENALLIFYGLFRFQIFMPFNINDEWLNNENEMYLLIEEHLVNNLKLNEDGSGTGETNKIDLFSIEPRVNEMDHISLNLSKGKFS